MKRTITGGIMMRGGIDMDNIDLTKKLVQLGTCGHEMTEMPLYLVGKIKTCYACHYKALQEARESEQTPRLPFDRDDAAILAAARTVAPEAVLTSGDLSREAYMEAQEPEWMTEAEADAQEFRDVKFGSKQWFDDLEEIPF